MKIERLRTSWVVRYTAAIAAAVLGLLVRGGVSALAGEDLPPYVFFFPFVMAVALVGGLGPGVACAFVSALLAGAFILNPAGGPGGHITGSVLSLMLFIGNCVAMILLAELYQRSRIKAAAFDRDEALRESRRENEFLANVIQRSSQPFASGDAQGHLVMFNRAFEKLLGYSAEELRLVDSRTLTPPEWQEFQRVQFAELHRTGQPVRFEKEFVRKDGSRVPVELLVHLLKDAEGAADRYYTFITDMTERKRHERALLDLMEKAVQAQRSAEAAGKKLHQIAEQRRLALEAADLGAWDYHFQIGEVYWDERCREMWGIPEVEHIEQARVMERVYSADREGTDKALEAALAGKNGGAFNHEFRIVWPDGSIHWIAGHGHVYFEGEEEARHPVRFIGTNHDITSRKRREEQLHRLNRTFKALTDSSRAMLHATSEAEYLKEVCRIVVEACGHVMAWVGYAEQDEGKTVRPVAWAGFEESYLDTLHITWADTERGRGPTGTAIRTGKPSGSAEVATDPRLEPWREEARKHGLAASMAVPLMADGKAFGALSIYSKMPDRFSEEETELLAELANDVSYCIGALRLREERARAERLGMAINSVNAVIHSTLDPAQILQSAVSEAAKAVGCETAAISLLRDGRWLISHVHGFLPDVIGVEMVPEQEPHAALALRTRQPVAIDDAFNDKRVDTEHMRQWGIRSVLVVPLITQHEPQGALLLNFQKAAVSFTPLHLDFAGKLASSLALALENAWLVEELRRELAERERAERRTELLASVASGLLSSESPQQIVESLCQKVLEFLDCQIFFNYLVEAPRGGRPAAGAETVEGNGGSEAAAPGDGRTPEGGQGRLRLNAYGGISAEEARRIEWLDYGGTVCGCTARDGCCIVAQDIPTTPDPRTELVKSFGIQAYACHPLMSAGGVLGTLSFGTRTRARLSGEDLGLMKAVADQVAVAIERQRAQAALREQAEDLKRSNSDLEQFAYVASHDLQEPLRAVGGYIRLLERYASEHLDGKARDYVKGALDGAVRMERLIQDLLAYSRVGSRGGKLVRTDLEELLGQVLGNLAVSLEAAPVTITHDPLPTLMANPTQLGQLLQNLMGNALKFRSERPPRIHVGAERQEGHWLFRVRDNGIGIEPQYFQKIFHLFQRLHTRREYVGTGIGLAVCKRIVERHGGRIWVESQPDQGSTFCFTIPQ